MQFPKYKRILGISHRFYVDLLLQMLEGRLSELASEMFTRCTSALGQTSAATWHGHPFNRKGCLGLPSLVILVEANQLLLCVHITMVLSLYMHICTAQLSLLWLDRPVFGRYVSSFLPNQNSLPAEMAPCAIWVVESKERTIYGLYTMRWQVLPDFQAIKTVMEPVPHLSCSAAVNGLLITWLYRI